MDVRVTEKHSVLPSDAFRERMLELAVEAAKLIYAEALRRQQVTPAHAAPSTALALFRAFADITDNHLAYEHWNYAVAGESSYRRYCDDDGDGSDLAIYHQK